MPQTVKSKYLDRKEHVWAYLGPRAVWKCVLCGALTPRPPEEPIPRGWVPETYEALAPEERALCPYRDGRLK